MKNIKDIIFTILLCMSIIMSGAVFLRVKVIQGEQGIQGIQGEKGDKGDNGLTPYIGSNGNWWTGTKDTGVLAKEQVEITTSYYAWQPFSITANGINGWIFNYSNIFDYKDIYWTTYSSCLMGTLYFKEKTTRNIKVIEVYKTVNNYGTFKINNKYFNSASDIIKNFPTATFSNDYLTCYITKTDNKIIKNSESTYDEIIISGEEYALIPQNI